MYLCRVGKVLDDPIGYDTRNHSDEALYIEKKDVYVYVSTLGRCDLMIRVSVNKMGWLGVAGRVSSGSCAACSPATSCDIMTSHTTPPSH